jgi:hypothetical protein
MTEQRETESLSPPNPIMVGNDIEA